MGTFLSVAAVFVLAALAERAYYGLTYRIPGEPPRDRRRKRR